MVVNIHGEDRPPSLAAPILSPLAVTVGLLLVTVATASIVVSLF
jgi:hypothetical protein